MNIKLENNDYIIFYYNGYAKIVPRDYGKYKRLFEKMINDERAYFYTNYVLFIGDIEELLEILR